jgi:hypothetical protein
VKTSGFFVWWAGKMVVVTNTQIGPHPNRDKYPNQRRLVVRIDQYTWLVPNVENDREIFLKTVIPSRKATKTLLGGEQGGSYDRDRKDQLC